MQCVECCQGKLVGNQRVGSLLRTVRERWGIGRWCRAHGEDSILDGGYSCETVALGRGELHVVEPAKRCRISCVAGAVWVTTSNRASDYILRAGECMLLQGRNKIIITGNGKDCQVRVSRQ